MHLLSLPLPLRTALKYRPSIPNLHGLHSAFPSSPTTLADGGGAAATQPRRKVKGWSWFVEVGQVSTHPADFSRGARAAFRAVSGLGRLRRAEWRT